MEKEYIELFVCIPYWINGRWEAYTSLVPIAGGYKVRIPVPQELVVKRLQDAEIIE